MTEDEPLADYTATITARLRRILRDPEAVGEARERAAVGLLRALLGPGFELDRAEDPELEHSRAIVRPVRPARPRGARGRS